MEIVNIKVTKLAANTGQVAGLPTNPRQWTAKDVERLARSLDETPELFDARPCLVYPYGDRFVVLGGNMRLAAAKHNGAKEVPCIVFPADTPADKLREIVVKDNGAFGAWDFDALANEWDDLPLVDWGVPVWEDSGGDIPSDLDAEPKNKPFVCKITFPTADDMTRFVTAYKDVLEAEYGCTISESGGEL